MDLLRRHGFTCLLLLPVGLSSLSAESSPARASETPAPAFTAEQVAKGRALYQRHCASCHGPRMQGEHVTPGLVGDRFDRSWRGKSAGVLAFHLRRMPPEPLDAPGGLGDETYVSILAHILQSNGFEAGDVALPNDLDVLEGMTIPALEGAIYEPDAPVVAAGESELLQALTPVTGEMLKSPPAEDWLQNGRTYDGHAYSPLTDINRDTVDFLSIAWRAPLRPGVSMPMPLVHKGVMFLHTFPDTVLALDATSGDVLWRFQYEPKSQSSQKMGLALSGNKVLVPTSDLHVLALEAKTGELIWDHEIVPETPAMRAAYQLRSAPLVVGDKVIQGVTASFVPKGGFAVALDLETGKEAWRFHSIARPGEPFGDTWNDVPLEKRSGGSLWHQGTYDPELDRIYFGIAPTYDTGPLLKPVEKEGVSSEAMYTNCTVALVPDTGEIDWCYQHVANDQWDLDWVFERQLVDIEINGRPRRTVINVGKMAILEALDAETGAYLFSVDAGIQNVITAIDPETGEKTIDPERLPDPKRPTDVCPSAFGARSWPSTSYSPQTDMVYVPLTESCMHMGPQGMRLLTSGVGIGPAQHPASADGNLGRLQAIDLENRKLGWGVDLETPLSTSVLATAGGVLFVGDMEPSLKAFDDKTGELLWQAALDAHPSSGVITYKVDGRQYVALVLGFNNFHIAALGAQVQHAASEAGRESASPPKGGAAIWVFAL
ncbi:MAG TPA: PQQ-binding-like beta-propeller repeat protein [Thermoanaerobaculia bacterium]|nr:PQQ-binding-like beta-propeller repeat protein [Thermoanaerobaculia bacterium]